MAGGGGEGELNLVPYMDIITTLILAMFVTVSTMTDPNLLRQSPVDAPGSGPGDGNSPPSVGISADGFVVTESDGSVRIAREDGAWPYARLAEVLRGLRDAGEDSATLTVHADPATPYSVLVHTMDAARSDDRGKLYPAVTLAVAAR